MKTALVNRICFNCESQQRERASVRIILLALVSFGLGVGVTAYWFHQQAKRQAENQVSQASAQPSVSQPAAPSANTTSSTQPFVETSLPASPEAIAEVKKALPNYASLSLDDAVDVLRQATLKDFAAAATEMQSKIGKAQEELTQAETKSPSDQQAAMKHLQEVQSEQSQKLQQIAGKLQTEITALKQLKSQQ
jgi:cytoskeletal protein RodZ